MGLSRDNRAPIEMTEEQKLEVYRYTDLVKLCEKRERHKNKIYRCGYYNLNAAKGTHLHDRYKQYNSEVQSNAAALRNERLNQAIRDFHNTINEIEIDKQLDGTAGPVILTRPVARHELRERTAIVGMIGVSLNLLDEGQALRVRAKLIFNTPDLAISLSLDQKLALLSLQNATLCNIPSTGLLLLFLALVLYTKPFVLLCKDGSRIHRYLASFN